MAINYHAAQDDFGSIVHRLQPMVLTNFVMWLDMKVAEFKVYGQMLLENENREIPNWYLRPNFDSETLVSMAKQKIQVPVSLVPKKVINKQTVHVPILPSHRNRSTRSQSATKLKNDTDKVIDSLEPTIVKHPRLHHAQGIDMLQEETDSSALTFVSKEYSQSDSPLYSTTRLEVSECEKRHMPSEETLNTSVEALDTSVEAIDSSQADSQCTARVVPKAEPVDEEFEVIENRLQTSTLSDTVDMLEHNIPLHDASVSSAIKTPLSTEKVAKTLVQSDGTMFLMPQTDKDATDTSDVPGLDFKESFSGMDPFGGMQMPSEDCLQPAYYTKHTGKKKLKSGLTVKACRYCSYTTVDHSNMKRHIHRRHSATTEFKCSLCPKQYSYKTDLSTHMKVSHNGKQSDISKAARYSRYCGYCSFETTNLQTMRQHVENHVEESQSTASEISTFMCYLCEISFNLNSDLMKHMLETHGHDEQISNSSQDVVPDMSPDMFTQQVQGVEPTNDLESSLEASG